jgi:hypothetical protein
VAVGGGIRHPYWAQSSRFFAFFVEVLGEGSGVGEVESIGFLLGGTDHGGGIGPAGFPALSDAVSVGTGELEAVEQGGSAADTDATGGDGVDDDRQRVLDAFAVFDGGEFDVLAGN